MDDNVQANDMSPDSSANGTGDISNGVDKLSMPERIPEWEQGWGSNQQAYRYRRALLMILAQARASTTDLMMYMSGPVIERIAHAALNDRPDPYPNWPAKNEDR